jgi:hypothetical protein
MELVRQGHIATLLGDFEPISDGIDAVNGGTTGKRKTLEGSEAGFEGGTPDQG